MLSLLLLQYHRVSVKGHQNYSETPRILPRRGRTPGFEIPGSATAKIIIYTQFLFDIQLGNWQQMFLSYCFTVRIKDDMIIVFNKQLYP